MFDVNPCIFKKPDKVNEADWNNVLKATDPKILVDSVFNIIASLQ